MAYTKLADSILSSTIWMEDDATRIVWFTLLAMADKNGEVRASIPGLANIARVPLDSCIKAIDKFLAQDEFSRTKIDGGKRLEEIDGGWVLINHAKYRELSTDSDRKAKDAERQRRYRERLKRNENVTVKALRVTVKALRVTPPSRQLSQAEADTDTDTTATTLASSLQKTEATKPEAAAVLTFETAGNPKTWELTQSDVDEWRSVYSVDVFHECQKARAWLLANQKKTARGMKRFLNSWLSRAQNAPRPASDVTKANPTPSRSKSIASAGIDGVSRIIDSDPMARLIQARKDVEDMAQDRITGAVSYAKWKVIQAQGSDAIRRAMINWFGHLDAVQNLIRLESENRIPKEIPI